MDRTTGHEEGAGPRPQAGANEGVDGAVPATQCLGASMLVNPGQDRILRAEGAVQRLIGCRADALCALSFGDVARRTGLIGLIDAYAQGEHQALGVKSMVLCDLKGHEHLCEVSVADQTADEQHLMLFSVRESTQFDHGEAIELGELNRARPLTPRLMDDGVIELNTDGTIRHLNDAASEQTGCSLHLATGKLPGTLFSLIDPETELPVDLNSLHTLGPDRFPADYLLVGRSGREVPVQVSFVKSLRSGDPRFLLIRDRREEHTLRWQMNFRARHDELTDLPNRVNFERAMASRLSPEALQSSHALLFIDLDQFKIVNDTCGHGAGDALLRRLATVLCHHVRRTDLLARVGTDQFAILMHGCSLRHAREKAGRILSTVASLRFSWAEHVFRPTVSIGVVEVNSAEETPASLLACGDVTCTLAKEHGRNRVEFCRAVDVPAYREQMRWVSRLLRACDDERFELHYQPIVSARADNTRPQYELLVRMRDTDGELITPGHFIAPAERYNLMPLIDRWVMGHALRELVCRVGEPLYTLSINLSGNSLSDEAFLAWAVAAVSEANPPSGALCFEITETAAVGNLQAVRRFIRQMHELGCLFSLDDFGSGLSSFAYLKDLAVDFVKIDGRFVRNICEDRIDYEMVDAITRVGHAMGISTVAEHVECDAAAECLRNMGVDYLQGYAFAQPALATREAFAVAVAPEASESLVTPPVAQAV